ncbi:MAG: hypothetical protein KDA45_07055, partial [Planctomycetales bacterium]|nr:hypothetical protein [Planctomycetales bacterium]
MPRRSGKVALLAMLLLLFMVVLIGLIGNTGHVTSQKMEMQNAVDATAFSNAMWRARAMNTITATNHLLGEATALCVLQEAWAGPELRLGLKVATGENRQLDSLIQLMAKPAPIGSFPSPYVPLGLTNLDRRIVDFVAKRTSPSGSAEDRSFATLYDSRVTLKRRFIEMLAAKWVANFLFLVPPPIGYGTAVVGYAAHAVCTARIVLIGKEWLLLEVLEKYAQAAGPLHEKALQEQLIPTLQGFALATAGIDAESGETDVEQSLIARASEDARERAAEVQRAEVVVYPSPLEFALPVEMEPKPQQQTWSGSWPSGWGEDQAAPLGALGSELAKAQSELNDAIGEMLAQASVYRNALVDLNDIEDDLREKLDAGDTDETVQAELRDELSHVERLRDELQSQLDKILDNVSEIGQQQAELEAALAQAGAIQSENLSLKHIPTRLNPEEERLTQWVRATTPNVDALRAPLLGLLEQHLKIS